VILTDRIERYIALYRPALLGSTSDTKGALWMSGMGRPTFPKAMSNVVVCAARLRQLESGSRDL
jgi:hypothetical protein